MTNSLLDCALGIDAGGTATRWALVLADGQLLASGETEPFSAATHTAATRAKTHAALLDLSRTVASHAQPVWIVMGVTGLGENPILSRWYAHALLDSLTTPLERVFMGSDLLLAYLSCIRPGDGYLVYAGTGSVAVYVDADGELQRLGGRGAWIDDAGAGYWIACDALRQIWRKEDEQPGAWQQSPLAQRLFAALGGAGWEMTREFVYHADRGRIGKLAIHVAASAQDDPLAAAILIDAGKELARLGNVAVQRFGLRPITLAGGAAHLHPLVLSGMQQHLMPCTSLALHQLAVHSDCARLAASGDKAFLAAVSRHAAIQPARSVSRSKQLSNHDTDKPACLAN